MCGNSKRKRKELFICGHVGIAGDLEYKDEATLKRLLILDYFRGPDSTGLAVFKKNGDSGIVKIDSHPINLFDSKKFTSLLSGYNSKVFLGHNRAATLGKVNEANAHPFKFGHIVGAHNGTLDRKSWNRLEEAAGVQTDVDSAAIFAAIEKVGIEETVSLMTTGDNAREGAWALVWFDHIKNTVNFLRNKHRPFWYAYTDDFKKVIWASEHPMIKAATAMSTQGYDLHVSKEGYSFWATDVDVWYEYDLDALAKGRKDRPKPRVKELKGREPEAVKSYSAAPFTRRQTPSTTTSHHGSTKCTDTPNLPEIIDIVTSSQNPLEDVMTEHRFQQIVKHGCSWCQKTITLGESGITLFPDRELCLCPEHSLHGDTIRVYLPRNDYKKFYEDMQTVEA